MLINFQILKRQLPTKSQNAISNQTLVLHNPQKPMQKPLSILNVKETKNFFLHMLKTTEVTDFADYKIIRKT